MSEAASLPATSAAADVIAFAPLLEARDVVYEARGARIVNDVSLKVRPQRLTAVMGANGAGKSLLLRLLHGLLEPTRGTVLWQGRPLDRAARRQQAMVFQRPVMLRRSVMANMRFGLAVRGVPRHERASLAREALEAARLDALAGRPARVLSGGEQQRLALARALACAPELLLLDEPTSSLDPASTQAIESRIRQAREDGVTVVMVTHDVGQARRLADDVVFLHAGRLVETGPAARVLEAPQSEAARAWLEGRLLLTDP